MTFDDLVRDRVIEPTTFEAGEIADLIRVSRRDIATANSLMGTDLDWAFAVAYNGILQTSVAFMASKGYRPRSRNKHFNTFRFMVEALPEEGEMMRRLQRLRKKRNRTVYEQVGLVGESEARGIIEFAEGYTHMIAQRMPAEVGHLLKEGDI